MSTFSMNIFTHSQPYLSSALFSKQSSGTSVPNISPSLILSFFNVSIVSVLPDIINLQAKFEQVTKSIFCIP